MTDDTSPADFAAYLTKRGWKFTTRPLETNTAYVVEGYPVIQGKNTGKRVTIAFPIPNDYPRVPPTGPHLLKPHGLVGNFPAVNESKLGPQWEYWSRKIEPWPEGRKNSRLYFDLVDRWLEGT
ncbi:MAG: hypothetical protein JRN35_10390 [Nitrososphaerota archaeon]|jgi:hypothetical protein|nr:hypothetical protein [Nitrososphaerota archaeon]